VVRVTDHVAEVLVRARNLLATGRWCKGVFEDSDDNMCTLGAIRNAARAETLFFGAPYESVEYAAVVQLAAHLPASYSVAGFNDDEDTTLQDVLTLFDKALADLGRAHEVTP
jgi:hypothetical protein